jgi:ABC-type transport system involved in cytochrome bd biosynthesis fused ATPase/permease subunit
VRPVDPRLPRAAPGVGTRGARMSAGERAVLLVTHRSGGLDRVDEVIGLEDGRVVRRDLRER